MIMAMISDFVSCYSTFHFSFHLCFNWSLFLFYFPGTDYTLTVFLSCYFPMICVRFFSFQDLATMPRENLASMNGLLDRSKNHRAS
jgi:hypothetical protein